MMPREGKNWVNKNPDLCYSFGAQIGPNQFQVQKSSSGSQRRTLSAAMPPLPWHLTSKCRHQGPPVPGAFAQLSTWDGVISTTICNYLFRTLLFLQLDLVPPVCLYSGTQYCSFPLKLVILRATAASSAFSCVNMKRKCIWKNIFLFTSQRTTSIWLSFKAGREENTPSCTNHTHSNKPIEKRNRKTKQISVN